MIQAMDAKRIGALELLDASIAHAHHLKVKLNAVVAEDPRRRPRRRQNHR